MNNIEFDYSKLRGKIREVFKKEENYAYAMGLSSTTISYKFNNKVPFTQLEMYKTMELLNINESDIAILIGEYFFTPKVEHVQQKENVQAALNTFN